MSSKPGDMGHTLAEELASLDLGHAPIMKSCYTLRMINPVSETLGDLLNKPYHYVIPKFQRGYAWREEEIAELIDDLLGSDTPLFLGTMIFDISDLRKKSCVNIVDGQQRLTSVLLLLIACRRAASKIGEHGIATITQNRNDLAPAKRIP